MTIRKVLHLASQRNVKQLLLLEKEQLKMPVFQKDPCGFFCILMTYGAILYADYVVVRWIVLQTMSGSLWGR